MVVVVVVDCCCYCYWCWCCAETNTEYTHDVATTTHYHFRFAYQCKAVLGVDLLPEELSAVFEFFDKDGGGTIDYGELLLKFSRREEMDILKAGHKKGKKYKPGFSNHRVNLERVKRRRAREINKKQMLEDKKRQRSARIRQNLRQAFEDRLANRINLGIREQRISIKDRQDNLVLTHQSQMKRKANK